jgi:hypothetical protein
MPGPPAGGPPTTGPGDLPYAGVRKDTIYICPRKLNIQQSAYYTIVVVHELAHFCGPVEGGANAIVDYSYRRKGEAFFRLTPWQAERTADCYAHFAGEAKLVDHEAPHSWRSRAWKDDSPAIILPRARVDAALPPTNLAPLVVDGNVCFS